MGRYENDGSFLIVMYNYSNLYKNSIKYRAFSVPSLEAAGTLCANLTRVCVSADIEQVNLEIIWFFTKKISTLLRITPKIDIFAFA